MSGSFFFNGRQYRTPVTVSAVDDTALADRNLTVGNIVAYIGQSIGGLPNTALRFSNPVDAAAALVEGELLTAVQKAFAPSSELPAPSTVIAIRVNPAVPSTLTLQDGSANNVIDLASTDYGQRTTQIKVSIANGSTSGKALTTSLGSSFNTEDNVGRRAFSVHYTGAAASASMTIDNTTVVLQAPTGNQVASIDLTTFKTIQQVADYISTVPDFTATALDGNGDLMALDGLDSVTGQDVKTAAYIARADLQAVIDWFNGVGETYVTATRRANAGAPPANISNVYLTGGSDGVVLTQNWADAFATLQLEDVQWLTPLTSDASIHAMADAHAQFMSTVGRKERRAIVGGALGQSVADVTAAALALNSDRTAEVYPGYFDYNASGNLFLYPPYMTAAVVAAAFAGAAPGTPLTNKSLTFRGLEFNINNPNDTDVLVPGGVLCVENTKTGYKVVQSVSTWLNNNNYNRVELSCGTALDFGVRNIRDALDVLRGSRGDPRLIERAIEITKSTCELLSKPDPLGPGVFVGDASSPPYKNISAALTGDQLIVSLQASPVIPNNYIGVVVYAVPFSATATA